MNQSIEKKRQGSTSTTTNDEIEGAEIDSSDQQARDTSAAPCYLSWVEAPFAILVHGTLVQTDEMREATGWAMDAAGRAPLHQAGAFVGAAVVRLATSQAGCNPPASCENTVYGFRPSSLITFASATVGVMAALTMPVVGAMVDRTKHRKLVGMVAALFVVIITGSQLILNEETWEFVLIAEAIGGYAFLVHTCAILAYLPELSPSEEQLTKYSSRFHTIQYAVQAMYLTLVIAYSHRTGAGTIESTRIALGIAFSISFVLLPYSWSFLLRKRGPLSEIPKGSSLFTIGFLQVHETARTVFKKYHGLTWFTISLLWSPANGAGVVTSIVVTFLTSYLNMTTIEIGIAHFLMLMGAFPGSLFSQLVMRKTNPLTSFRMSVLLYSIATAMPGAFLRGPNEKEYAYVVALLWGISIGWMVPSQRVLFCTLIPRGQETEFMGIFTFVDQILGWLPPLLFSAMNERGVDMRVSVSILPFFLLLSLCCTARIGSYQNAVDLAIRETTRAQGLSYVHGNQANPTPLDF